MNNEIGVGLAMLVTLIESRPSRLHFRRRSVTDPMMRRFIKARPELDHLRWKHYRKVLFARADRKQRFQHKFEVVMITDLDQEG